MSPSRPRMAALAVCLGLLGVSGSSAARAGLVTNANVSVNESLSSLPANASVQLLALGTSSLNGFVADDTLTFAGSDTISFTGTAGVYHGAVNSIAAPPWTQTGADTANYLAAEPSGSVTFTYSSDQKYFGLLWGSVDNYNTLNFYEGNTLVDQISGSQIAANANGDQTANGSYFVNVNFNGSTAYNRVVATDTTNPAFEFDSVAYAAQTIATTNVAGQAPTQVMVSDAANPTVLGNAAPVPAWAGTPLGTVVLIGGVGLMMSRRRGTLIRPRKRPD
jgi:hypothetical protein